MWVMIFIFTIKVATAVTDTQQIMIEGFESLEACEATIIKIRESFNELNNQRSWNEHMSLCTNKKFPNL